MKDHHALVAPNPADPPAWQEMTILHGGKAYRFVIDPVVWEKHHAMLSKPIHWPGRDHPAPAFARTSGDTIALGALETGDTKVVGRYLGIVPEPGAK